MKPAASRRAMADARRSAARLAVAASALWLVAGCGAGRAPKPLPPPTPNEVLLTRARARLAERKFDKARLLLTEIGTREVLSQELDPHVKIAIADSYFYQPGIANLIEAQSRYTQFVNFHPSHDLAAYSQFQVGMCYFLQSPQPHHDQTYTRRALEEFEKVRTLNPAGRFVAAAEEMRARCLEKLAEHDYQVAMFYYRKKAYAGAIGRFKSLLDSYPRYEESDAVFYHLGIALIRSGSENEGRIYLEKVATDYPSSKFASEARAALEKSQG